MLRIYKNGKPRMYAIYNILLQCIKHFMGKRFETKLSYVYIYILPLHVFPVPQKGFDNFESNFLKATKHYSCVFDTLYLYFSTCYKDP